MGENLINEIHEFLDEHDNVVPEVLNSKNYKYFWFKLNKGYWYVFWLEKEIHDSKSKSR